MIKMLLLVGLGGGLGAMLRFATVHQVTRLLGTGFPAGTMIVNIAGSFLIGILAGVVLARLPAGNVSVDEWRALLMTGVLGGFTTFSAFSLDVMVMWERREVVLAGLYIGGSVIGSIFAVAVGLMLARSLGGSSL